MPPPLFETAIGEAATIAAGDVYWGSEADIEDDITSSTLKNNRLLLFYLGT